MWKRSNQYTRGPWALTFCLTTHLAIDQICRQMSHIHTFYPRWVEISGSKLSLFSRYQQWFPRYRPILKITIFGHEIGHWPKLQKLHIYSLSTPVGRNLAYFRSTGSGFRDTGQISKFPYLPMKLGQWPKSHKLHIHSLNYPRVRNFTLFCSTACYFQELAILHFPIGHNVKF